MDSPNTLHWLTQNNEISTPKISSTYSKKKKNKKKTETKKFLTPTSRNQSFTQRKKILNLPGKITYFLPKEEFLIITRKKKNPNKKFLILPQKR